MNNETKFVAIPEKFSLPEPPTLAQMLIMGDCMSGRTTLCVSLLNKLAASRCIVFCGNEDEKMYWQDKCQVSEQLFNSDKSPIRGDDEKDMKFLKQVLAYQQHKIRSFRKFMQQRKKSYLSVGLSKSHELGIVFCNVRDSFLKHKQELFSNARHWYCTVIIDYFGSTPRFPLSAGITCNLDYIFILRTHQRERETIYKYFYLRECGILSSEFDIIVNEITAKNGSFDAVIIDNMERDEKKILKWYPNDRLDSSPGNPIWLEYNKTGKKSEEFPELTDDFGICWL